MNSAKMNVTNNQITPESKTVGLNYCPALLLCFTSLTPSNLLVIFSLSGSHCWILLSLLDHFVTEETKRIKDNVSEL